jgi:hypothetical protein
MEKNRQAFFPTRSIYAASASRKDLHLDISPAAQVRKRVACPLQKGHGDVSLEKMLAAVLGGASSRMPRKAKKRQSANAWKWR